MKRACARERPAARVQEELRPVAPVEVRAAHCDVAAQRVDGGPAERDEPLLRALAERAHEPLLEIDRPALEARHLADPQAGAVHQLDESTVAHRPRRRPVRRVDQALRLARRERLRQPARALRQLQRRGRVVLARAEQHLMAEERAERGDPARDRRGCDPGGAHLGEPALELLRRRLRDRTLTPGRELQQVAPVRLDRARRPPGREQRQESVELGVGSRRHGRSRFPAAARTPLRAGMGGVVDLA